jgi:hypothetical protein
LTRNSAPELAIVGQVLAEVLRAQRRDLVGHHGPVAVLGQIVVHRLGDGVTVGVVRRHERRLAVLAEVFHQYRADGVGRGLAVEILTEAVAHAVLPGGVVGAGDAGDVKHLLALGELVERDRDRGRGRTGHQRDLVVVDEGLLLLHRLVRLGAAVGNDELHLFAEHALGDLGRDLLDQLMALVDVLDRKLHALELVLALHGIGAGARHRGADGHGGAGAAVRVGPDRWLISGKRVAHEGEPAGAAGGERAEPGAGCDRLPQQPAPRECRERGFFVVGHGGLPFLR